MGVVGALGRNGARRHAAALLALAVALAVGLGAGLVSLEAAERTENAYPDYLQRAQVADLVVNPVIGSEEAEAIMRDTPGVLDLRVDSLFAASVGRAEPSRTQDDLQLEYLQARMSADGRYLDQDRPVIDEGRMLDPGAAEVFLDVAAADRLDVAVGDEVPLYFYSQSPDGEYAEIGHRPVTVAGIGTFADGVLPDELYPQSRMLISPAVGEEFDCVIHQPAEDDPRSAAEIFRAVFPPDCAVSYRYYSMRIEGGDAGARTVADRLAAAFRRENAHLPAAMRQADVMYSIIPTFTADQREQVRQSLAPAVTALRTFGITALVVTIGLGLLLVARHLRRRAADLVIWRSLGLGPGRRTLAVALPPAVVLVGGVTGGLIVAWAASPVGPIASARTVEPDPGRSLETTTLLAAVAALLVLSLGLALNAHRLSARAGLPARPPRRTPSFTRSRPFADLGLRAALRSAGAGAVIAVSVLAVTAVSGTVVFTTSLGDLVGTPPRFGWTADAAAVINAGYGQTHARRVAATLDDHPDVERWGIAALSGGLDINGTTLPLVADVEGYAPFAGNSIVIDGHIPEGDDEIALGALTVDDLGLEIGDEATVTMPYGERTARVSGTVVLPAVGPLESDRSSMGTGVYLPAPFFTTLLDQAEAQSGRSGAQTADSLAAFVVVDLADGVDPDAFWADLGDEAVAGWDRYHVPPFEYAGPVRPATILDIAAMRHLPTLLAGALALALAVSVVAGITAGTRARRRELGVVEAMGATRRQLRASIRVHSLAVVAIGLVVGLPVGVALGRLAFRRFAEDLGTTTDVTVPLGLLTLIVVSGLVLALLAAAVGARYLGRGAARLLPDDAGLPVRP